MIMPATHGSSGPSTAATPAPPLRQSKPRVLIVDDEETIRLAFSRFLGMRGYEVETAPSGDMPTPEQLAECQEMHARALLGILRHFRE